MVGRIPCQRQVPAFDRIGKDHNGLGVDGERLGKGFEDPPQVVSAKIGQQRFHFIRLIASQQLGHSLISLLAVLHKTITDSDPVLEQQTLILLITHLIDPGSEFKPIGFTEEVFERGAVFQIDDMPAVGGKHFPQLLGAAIRDDAVEALTVQVNDPQHTRHPLNIGFAQRFPNITLIQLSITNQCNMPA